MERRREAILRPVIKPATTVGTCGLILRSQCRTHLWVPLAEGQGPAPFWLRLLPGSVNSPQLSHLLECRGPDGQREASGWGAAAGSWRLGPCTGNINCPGNTSTSSTGIKIKKISPVLNSAVFYQSIFLKMARMLLQLATQNKVSWILNKETANQW